MNIVKHLPTYPESLSDAHLAQFEAQGYLAFTDVLSADEVSAINESKKQLCVEMVKGIDTGRCKLEYAKRGDAKTCIVQDKNSPLLVQFEASVDINTLKEDELFQSYRKLMYAIDASETFVRLKTHPKLTAMRDALLGPDSIYFQDMALSKPAFIGTEKPWHQDNAYFQYAPLQDILGIWIALDDATIDNGCMQVIPTPRHQLDAFKHEHIMDCDITDADLDKRKALAIEIPAGGAMFFFGMLPHHSAPNRSCKSRRALQLHYRGAHTTKLDPTAYGTLFKTRNGTPAACGT